MGWLGKRNKVNENINDSFLYRTKKGRGGEGRTAERKEGRKKRLFFLIKKIINNNNNDDDERVMAKGYSYYYYYHVEKIGLFNK